ncbi:MAG: PepSY-associated TM helix domain-containing protein [Verrucomicrobiota bacterium]
MHFWAAAIGSLPALLLCISGLILVFEDELQAFEERAYSNVEAEERPLPIGELLSEVQENTGAEPTYIALPSKPTQAALVGTEDRRYHFVNPYSGKINKSTEAPAIAMRAVRVFHTSFFMGRFGTWIGIISSLFLISLCLTGCYLFLKRRISLVRKFRIKWSSPARRHYDLHAVSGFVTAIPILLIALSGALIGLGAPWRDAILFLTGSEWKPRPKLQTPVERAQWNFNYEELLQIADAAAPADMYVESIILPRKTEDPIALRFLYPWATRPASWAFINPSNGTLIEFHHHWDFEAGHLIHRLNRGFHSGEIYTEAMRWLWFRLMIIPFLLAYTGYQQWRRKRSIRASRNHPSRTLSQ